ncbi:MAG TPA: hypothetical protein PK263_05575, partial [bacterium]|nr:hypothetical protein [bacterium]
MASNQFDNNLIGFYDNRIISQSLLDVFVLQNVLDGTEAEELKERFSTNREIEKYLLKNKIVTQDTINKAYGIILKLPYIELNNFNIPEQVKTVIPEKIARKFGILPVGLIDGVLRIATSRPSEMLVGFQRELEDLFSRKNIEVEILVTGKSDFDEVVKQYRKRSGSDAPNTLPVVYLRNQLLPKSFVYKIPREFIDKYRLVVFGQNRRGHFLVASEQPESSTTKKIISFLEQENGIKVEVFATSKDDIDYVLSVWDKAAPIPTKNARSSAQPSDRAGRKKGLPPQPSSSDGFGTSLRTFLSGFSSQEPGRVEITIDSVEGEKSDRKSFDPEIKPAASQEKGESASEALPNKAEISLDAPEVATTIPAKEEKAEDVEDEAKTEKSEA